MRIFNLYLPLVFIKGLNGEPDRFVHELTQDVELTMQYKSKNIRMPQCILFSIRDYEYISSIYYDTIFNELTSYGSHEILDGRINQALLNMLSAFDKTCNKKLLDKAIELSEWIYSNCISLPMEIKLINKLQAIKRKRSLNMEELAELEVLSIQKNDAEVNTAIYLLLENVEKANIYYKQIEKKKAFKSFPRLVNSQSMLNYNSKYDYMKMLRGLFSNYEEAVLFCNSISDFGVQWEALPNSTSDINNSFITKYNLIKNLSPDFIDVVNIRQFYPNVIYEGFDFISHERLELEKLYT